MSCEYTAIRVHFNLRDVQADRKSQCSQWLARISPQRCWALSGKAPGEMASKPNDAFGLRLLLLGDLCRLRSSYRCMVSLFYMCFYKEMGLLRPFSIKALAYPGVFPFSLTPAPGPHFYFTLLPDLLFQVASISSRKN